MLSKAAAAQRQLDSITAAAAHNASSTPRSAPLSKAEQEHKKRREGGFCIGSGDFSMHKF